MALDEAHKAKNLEGPNASKSGAQSTHYLGVFLRYVVKGEDGKNVTQSPLVGLALHLDETEADTEAHIDLVKAILWLYDLNLSDLNAVAANNTALNKKFAREIVRPFLGCNLHRLNLAVNVLFLQYNDIIEKVRQIMFHFKGQKARAHLRKHIPLTPVVSNAPRWTVKFAMVERLLKIYKHMIGDATLRREINTKGLVLTSTEEETRCTHS
uniref:DUF659 domain-containing protein n=1 Tax=Chromera velia CCMP2878 TaxID=1169474 RepID=A0A0G4F481_9ALVE|eukprot:Cvel_14948.t1-p1 / transcript=Cvel_14948.t1 / gene=Cvel_14948 / organism=Chromera_velia_CCMP2878 / gene_product=hypothetical protein / transcript_product=hypothetical protein / location=Cvel_scaffold1085:1312-9522(+) / protein_length=210 / sequence_SO=supercontig / SO=protein_coding / is_pseudo=false